MHRMGKVGSAGQLLEANVAAVSILPLTPHLAAASDGPQTALATKEHLSLTGRPWLALSLRLGSERKDALSAARRRLATRRLANWHADAMQPQKKGNTTPRVVALTSLPYDVGIRAKHTELCC
ncbi:MAG: hypothetical protein KatS3mg111_1160 [Pirellulaceae bacterium]|nr:MAG: hypothetical protein KatS3mg111_1160 [Pirellulaceae bacterium]